MYCCPVECPGKIPQPHHLPGYAGHIPTKRARCGATFGRISRDVIEDPCVAQAPCPILAPPAGICCPPDPCLRNPVGCEDIGCCDPVCCPPPPVYQKPKKPPCPELCCDPCKIMECFPGQSQDCCQPRPGCVPPASCSPSCRPGKLNCGPQSSPGYGSPSSRPMQFNCGPPSNSGCGSQPSRPMQFNVGPPSSPGCGSSPPRPMQFNCGPPSGQGCGSSQPSRPPPRNCVEELENNSCDNPCCRPTTPPCPPKNRRPTGCFEEPQKYYTCGPNPAPECSNYEARAHHLNRGPYCCPCKPEPDCNVYRCCEPMSSSYAGHIPGFTFHSTSRTTGKASWGTKQYMNKCFYFNTWTKP